MDVLEEIDFYEKYCEEHKDYKNSPVLNLKLNPKRGFEPQMNLNKTGFFCSHFVRLGQKKNPGTVRFQGFFEKSALGELGCAAGGLQTVLLTLGSRNPLWRNGLRTHVFKIAILIATLFIAVSLFYTLSRLYRDTNGFYDMMATWKTL